MFLSNTTRLVSLYFIVSLVSVASTEGADWVLIDKSAQDDYVYLDLESIQGIGNNGVRLWSRILFSRPNPEGIMESLNQFELYCSNRAFQSLKTTVVYEDGNTISMHYAWPDAYRTDSIINTIFTFACTYKK